MTTELRRAVACSDRPQEAAGARALKADICEVTRRQCVEEFGDRLRSVVLTGSLARDEGTAVRHGEGWSFLGDAEFLLIFQEGATLPPAPDLSLLCSKIRTVLLEGGIECTASLSASHADYLLKMRPHIFAYELRYCGQVIWGEPTILSLIPAFSPSQIPLEDAWRMLANRMVELLEVAGEPAGAPGIAPPSLQYRVVKLYLDMATSLLLFQGAYEPTYRGRAERLQSLAAAAGEDGGSFFPLRDFSEQVSECTEFKLGRAGLNVPPATLGPRSRPLDAQPAPTNAIIWNELSADVRVLWRWELERLTGADSQLSDRELLRRWMKLQAAGKRLRGWAHVVRKCGWHRSWRHWPRWLRLARRGSPRHCVYAAASEIFFKLGELSAPAPEAHSPDTEIQELRSWLPLPNGSRKAGIGGKNESSESRIGSWGHSPTHYSPLPAPVSWQGLCPEIAWNYHEFLEGTRA